MIKRFKFGNKQITQTIIIKKQLNWQKIFLENKVLAMITTGFFDENMLEVKMIKGLGSIFMRTF